MWDKQNDCALIAGWYPIWYQDIVVDLCCLLKTPICNKFKSTGGSAEYQNIFNNLKPVVWLYNNIFSLPILQISTPVVHSQHIHITPLTALFFIPAFTQDHYRSYCITAWKTFTTSSFSPFTACKAIKASFSTQQNSSFTTVVNRNAHNHSPSTQQKSIIW